MALLWLLECSGIPLLVDGALSVSLHYLLPMHICLCILMSPFYKEKAILD